ncbi:hypothetical protein LCGC14_1275460, partial [marine sediment metagenome]
LFLPFVKAVKARKMVKLKVRRRFLVSVDNMQPIAFTRKAKFVLLRVITETVSKIENMEWKIH